MACVQIVWSVIVLLVKVSSELCVDHDANCDYYGFGVICIGDMIPWSLIHCQNYCGLCKEITAEPCADLDADCARYDFQDICIGDNVPWSQVHCRKFCEFCGPAHSTTTHTVQTTTPSRTTAAHSNGYQSQSTTHSSSTHHHGSGHCADRDPDCDSYDFDLICTGDYVKWSNVHCKKYCEFCEETTTAGPCVDINSDCSQFGFQEICIGDFVLWSQVHCRKYCDLCSSTRSADCDFKVADICFIVDSSESVNATGFTTVLDFMSSIVQNLYINISNGNQVCVIPFGSSASIAVHLPQYSTQEDIVSHAPSITYTGGSTRTDLGLNLAMSELSAHSRNHTNKKAILISVGKSSEPQWTMQQANLLKSHGIKVYTVSVGDDVQHELSTLASGSVNAFQVGSLSQLPAVKKSLVDRLCAAQLLPSTNAAGNAKEQTTSTTTAAVTVHQSRPTSHTAATRDPATTATTHRLHETTHQSLKNHNTTHILITHRIDNSTVHVTTPSPHITTMSASYKVVKYNTTAIPITTRTTGTHATVHMTTSPPHTTTMAASHKADHNTTATPFTTHTKGTYAIVQVTTPPPHTTTSHRAEQNITTIPVTTRAKSTNATVHKITSYTTTMSVSHKAEYNRTTIPFITTRTGTHAK